LETVVASAVQRATGLIPEESRKVAQLVSESVRAMDAGDQQKALQAQNAFMTHMPDMAVAEKVFNMMYEGWGDIRKLERFISIRMPYFMSERRFGDFGLWWKDENNKLRTHYFKSSDARSKFINEQQVQPLRQTNPDDKNFGVPEYVFEHLGEVQDKGNIRLNELLGEKDAKEVSQIMDISSELRSALSARDVLKLTTPRKGAKGREFLDMFDTHQDYVQSVITAAKNRQMRLEADLLLSSKEFQNQPIIKNLLVQQMQHVMKPDTQFGSFVNN